MFTTSVKDAKLLRNPPKEYIDYYIERTRNHIFNVIKCGDKLIANIDKYSDYSKRLVQQVPLYHYYSRLMSHDLSKFSKIEYFPYIWMSWFYKCKNENIDFEYPNSYIEEAINEAVNHHYKVNKHHFNENPNMNILDIMEMVSDVIAMSVEFKDDPLDYFKSKIFTDSRFNNNYEKFITELCNEY